jgi:hypothetical protein
VGCTGCCHQLVQITLLEGLVIVDELLSLPTDVASSAIERVRADLPMVEGLPDDASKARGAYFERAHPCPLLVDGRCIVYRGRPGECRLHFVASDPADCYPPVVRTVAFFDTSSVREALFLEGADIAHRFNLLTLVGTLQQMTHLAFTLALCGRAKFEEELQRASVREVEFTGFKPVSGTL